MCLASKTAAAPHVSMSSLMSRYGVEEVRLHLAPPGEAIEHLRLHRARRHSHATADLWRVRRIQGLHRVLGVLEIRNQVGRSSTRFALDRSVGFKDKLAACLRTGVPVQLSPKTAAEMRDARLRLRLTKVGWRGVSAAPSRLRALKRFRSHCLTTSAPTLPAPSMMAPTRSAALQSSSSGGRAVVRPPIPVALPWPRLQSPPKIWLPGPDSNQRPSG